jgi:hypothetical protein
LAFAEPTARAKQTYWMLFITCVLQKAILHQPIAQAATYGCRGFRIAGDLKQRPEGQKLWR